MKCVICGHTILWKECRLTADRKLVHEECLAANSRIRIPGHKRTADCVDILCKKQGQRRTKLDERLKKLGY
jgi:hypothetical protein